MTKFSMFQRSTRLDVPSDANTASAIQESDIALSTTSLEAVKEGTICMTGQDDWVKVPQEAIPAQDAQQGIQKIEAVTLTWGKKSLTALLFK
jgi:hypothetical protein